MTIMPPARAALSWRNRSQKSRRGDFPLNSASSIAAGATVTTGNHTNSTLRPSRTIVAYGPDMRCAVDVAPLRSEPRDDAEQVSQALHGEPLRVVEEREGWARVI